MPARLPALLECVQTSDTGSPSRSHLHSHYPAPPKTLSSKFTLFPSILPLFSLTSSNSFHNNQTKYPDLINPQYKGLSHHKCMLPELGCQGPKHNPRSYPLFNINAFTVSNPDSHYSLQLPQLS